MNEISAAEALEIFHAADWHSGYPKDIVARDFLECYKLHREIRRAVVIDNRNLALNVDDNGPRSAGAGGDVTEDSKNFTEKDLDELFSRAPQQRKIVDVIRRNKDHKISLAEIAIELGGVNKSIKTVQNLLTRIYKKTKTKNLIELAQKLPPLPPQP